jgi:hemin uptake protein HemP
MIRTDGHISGQRADAPVVIRAQDLFCGARTVVIEHEGQRYFLRITKESKLILTK